MRKFALVILDDLDKVIDRYNLDLVTSPNELGFSLDISKLDGDIRDTLTKVRQSKKTVTFTVNHHIDPYSKTNTLALWIQKYSPIGNTMALEYDDGKIVRYCEGRVVNLPKTEKNMFNNIEQQLGFLQTTPFFVKRSNTIVIKTSDTGKSYPFKYPYAYGRTVVENTEINNPYIDKSPLVITIDGAINNPEIKLVDSNDTAYNIVKFTGETLLAGQQILINSAQHKIYKIFVDGHKEDYSPKTDPSFDSYLEAQIGFSRIEVNAGSGTPDENFKVIGGWREYRL